MSHLDPPPDDLLEQWGIIGAPTVPVRGRTGPYPQQPPPPTTSTQDQTALLTTAIIANMTRHRSPSPRSPSKHHCDTPSPSPPPVDKGLEHFLDRCVEKVHIPQSEMDRAFDALNEKGYTVYALGHQTFNRDEISALTGLQEGTAMSIHALAEEWCDRHYSKKRHVSRR